MLPKSKIALEADGFAERKCQPSNLRLKSSRRADNPFGPRGWERPLATKRVERRLAAILAADVAGYSRLIGADEEGTLARLKAHRRELIPKFWIRAN